jgi:hypothetical protein
MFPDGDEPDDELDEGDEQDLLVVLKLSNRMMGTATERMAIEEFADQLETAITEAGVGEYDGDEIGGGECILFFCGPDIDRLLQVVHPLLKRSPLCRGGHLVRMVAGPDGEPERQRLPI